MANTFGSHQNLFFFEKTGSNEANDRDLLGIFLKNSDGFYKISTRDN